MTTETAIGEKPFSEVFNESSAALYAAFPERLDKLVVLVTPLTQPVYISPDIAEHLSRNVGTVKGAVEEVTYYMERLNMPGGACLDYPLAGDTVKIIALQENPSGSFSLRYTKEMACIATFDHEMGHLVVKNGFSDDNHLAECAADAYAALRHIQRFGKDTDFFEYCNMAYAVILEPYPIHYTNNVLQKVKQLLGEQDISRLSLRETAALAATIAEECPLPAETLKKLGSAFIPARDALNKPGWGDALHECVSVMRENKNDPDIYQAGKQVLNFPSFKKYINEAEPFWKDALDWMARHEKESGTILAAPAAAAIPQKFLP